MAVAALVITAIAAASSAVQQRRAAAQQRRAARAEKRIQDLQNIRERTRAFAAARQGAAQIENLQAVSGVGGSTGAGARASLLTQSYSNVGFAQQLERLGNQRYNYLQSASRFMTSANNWQAVSSISRSFAGG